MFLYFTLHTTPINLGFLWRNFLPKWSYFHPPLNSSQILIQVKEDYDGEKLLLATRGKEKRKILETYNMAQSLEHFHTFLLCFPSYTILAVIFHSTIWGPSGSSLHFSRFSMNTQKGKGKEMNKLYSNMPTPFSAIYA